MTDVVAADTMAAQDTPVPADNQTDALPETDANVVDMTPTALSKAAVEASEPYQTLNQQYLRLAADFENYRKRTLQEQDNLRKYGAEQTLKTLLSALDNIDRGLNNLSAATDSASLYQSLQMLHQELTTKLQSVGLTPMEVAGQLFDPTLHEAITRQPSDTVPEDHVIAALQTGYCLHDRVIRPALVSVSSGAV
jgi:molecular chaperone GrpE